MLSNDDVKKGFILYLDYEEHINLLTDEQLGQLIRAIFEYEKTRETPELDGIIKMAFSFIKAQLDRDREKYERKVQKNRENGAKGGRPRKVENQMENKETQKTERFYKNQWDNYKTQKSR